MISSFNCIEQGRTEDEDFLFVRLRERISRAEGGLYNDCAVDGGTGPIAVRMPPESPLLRSEQDLVSEVGPRRDRTLRDVLGPVKPWVPRLFNAVPASIKKELYEQN